MAGVERRAALGEIRIEGRKLTGTVMRYGEVSPTHKERFAPGSLRMADAVHLDLNHDRERAVAWHPGGGLELRDEDGAMILSAELPPIPAADRALDEISGARRRASTRPRLRLPGPPWSSVAKWHRTHPRRS